MIFSSDFFLSGSGRSSPSLRPSHTHPADRSKLYFSPFTVSRGAPFHSNLLATPPQNLEGFATLSVYLANQRCSQSNSIAVAEIERPFLSSTYIALYSSILRRFLEGHCSQASGIAYTCCGEALCPLIFIAVLVVTTSFPLPLERVDLP